MARVRAYLAARGAATAATPQQVIEMAGDLEVDGVLVVAITAFDPYDPPKVGLTVALFRRPLADDQRMPDPIELSREPALVRHESVQTALVNQQALQFDARNAEVIERVKAFADRRGGAAESPWGWRRVVVSAPEYLAFCSYEALRTLLASEAEMIAAEERKREHEVHELDELHE
jgi:hypothetical protein